MNCPEPFLACFFFFLISFTLLSFTGDPRPSNFFPVCMDISVGNNKDSRAIIRSINNTLPLPCLYFTQRIFVLSAFNPWLLLGTLLATINRAQCRVDWNLVSHFNGAPKYINCVQCLAMGRAYCQWSKAYFLSNSKQHKKEGSYPAFVCLVTRVYLLPSIAGSCVKAHSWFDDTLPKENCEEDYCYDKHSLTWAFKKERL